jgi:hypothetical protein
VLKILCRLNRWYFDDMQKADIVSDLEITREDFAKNTDVEPVSDPHIFSETQRMAQSQAVLALAEKHPEQFKMNNVISRLLKQMKVPNINDLMNDVPAPEQRTSADENSALLLGQPAYAYIQQDHIAHIQDHLQFAMNPFLGQSPFADPSYLNNLIEHVKQHMTLWYLNRSNGYVQEATGKPVDDYENPNYTPTIDKVYTAIGAHVMMDTNEVFGQFAPSFQKLIQMSQQRSSAQPPLPPDAQVVKDTSMAETQRKTQKDQQDFQIAQAKLAKDSHDTMVDNQTKIAIKNAELTHKTISSALEMQAQAQPPVNPAAPAAPTTPNLGEQNVQ